MANNTNTDKIILSVLPLKELVINPNNPRTCTDDKMDKLVNSLLCLPKMLKARPIVIAQGKVVQGGNMRTLALNQIASMAWADVERRLDGCRDYNRMSQKEQAMLRMAWKEFRENPLVPVYDANSFTDDEIKQFIIKDNASFGAWDWDMLANEWDAQDLAEWGVDAWQDIDGNDGNGAGGDAGSAEKEQHAKLTDRFVVPPFTILDTRQGYWQERKKMWRELIGDCGESREGTLDSAIMAQMNNGVSILDPVMAEIVCKWFGIDGGSAFDCFAGDTVFGYVAASLGMQFTGIEIREEQAALNNERTQDMAAHYICDDGQNVAQHIPAASQDLLFSCPPYYDLEVYSDKPNDASNQDTYEDFIAILRNAFTSAVGCLKDNRFAVIVVGDVRDKQGCYYDFPADIKRIMRDAGMHLYNEAVLVEPIGTLPQRVGNNMRTRKLGKCHQNILIFYKGKTKDINKYFAPIEYSKGDVDFMQGGNVDAGEDMER